MSNLNNQQLKRNQRANKMESNNNNQTTEDKTTIKATMSFGEICDFFKNCAESDIVKNMDKTDCNHYQIRERILERLRYNREDYWAAVKKFNLKMSEFKEFVFHELQFQFATAGRYQNSTDEHIISLFSKMCHEIFYVQSP